METVRALFGRINIGSVALGAALLIAPKELRKQAMWYNNVTKNVRRYDDAVLSIAVGLVGAIARYELLERAMIYGLAFAIKDVYEEMISKEPFVVMQTGSIEGWNFDANAPVTITIDGTTVTDRVSTDANGYFKYTPATPFTAGVHDIVVSTSRKTFGGKVAI